MPAGFLEVIVRGANPGTRPAEVGRPDALQLHTEARDREAYLRDPPSEQWGVQNLLLRGGARSMAVRLAEIF